MKKPARGYAACESRAGKARPMSLETMLPCGGACRSTYLQFWLLVLTLAFLAPARALHAQTQEARPRRILLLYSYEREEGVISGFDQAFRKNLRARLSG